MKVVSVAKIPAYFEGRAELPVDEMQAVRERRVNHGSCVWA